MTILFNSSLSKFPTKTYSWYPSLVISRLNKLMYENGIIASLGGYRGFALLRTRVASEDSHHCELGQRRVKISAKEPVSKWQRLHFSYACTCSFITSFVFVIAPFQLTVHNVNPHASMFCQYMSWFFSHLFRWRLSDSNICRGIRSGCFRPGRNFKEIIVNTWLMCTEYNVSTNTWYWLYVG